MCVCTRGGEYVCIHKNVRMRVYVYVFMVESDLANHTVGFTNEPFTLFVVIVMTYGCGSDVVYWTDIELCFTLCADAICAKTSHYTCDMTHVP